MADGAGVYRSLVRRGATVGWKSLLHTRGCVWTSLTAHLQMTLSNYCTSTQFPGNYSQADLRKNGFWRPISAPEAPFALKFEVHIGPNEGKTRVENTRF